MGDLPPKAVVGHAILFPSQRLHCPCVKWGFWDGDSLAVSNLFARFSQCDWSCTTAILFKLLFKATKARNKLVNENWDSLVLRTISCSKWGSRQKLYCLHLNIFRSQVHVQFLMEKCNSAQTHEYSLISVKMLPWSWKSWSKVSTIYVKACGVICLWH